MSEMCAALKVTRQGYYAWKSRAPSAHAMRDAELAELISQVRTEVTDAGPRTIAPRETSIPTATEQLQLLGRRPHGRLLLFKDLAAS